MKKPIYIILFIVLLFSVLSSETDYDKIKNSLKVKVLSKDINQYYDESKIEDTKKAFKELYIAINSYMYVNGNIPYNYKNLKKILESDDYLDDELPKEYFKGKNKLVKKYDGTGGWILIEESPMHFFLSPNIFVENNKTLRFIIYYKKNIIIDPPLTDCLENKKIKTIFNYLNNDDKEKLLKKYERKIICNYFYDFGDEGLRLFNKHKLNIIKLYRDMGNKPIYYAIKSGLDPFNFVNKFITINYFNDENKWFEYCKEWEQKNILRNAVLFSIEFEEDFLTLYKRLSDYPDLIKTIKEDSLTEDKINEFKKIQSIK